MATGEQSNLRAQDNNSGRESGLVQRLRRSLEDLGEARPSRVLVGYSGGADSLALLSLLTNLAKHQGFEVRAVHVDHRARQGSALDAATAKSVAADLGVGLDVRAVLEVALAEHAGVGREEALRRERYRIFAKVTSAWGADLVALAHHQRDQAESVLLHLLRGAGVRGASGMRPLTEFEVPWWDAGEADVAARTLKVWRPLLGESVGELEEYARSLGVPILVDESNEDESYRRNAIRHSVLPLLEQVAPGATINLARFAELAGEDSGFLDGLARRHVENSGNSRAIDRGWLMELPLAIRRRVVQFWIEEQAPTGFEVSLNRIDEVLRVAAVKGRPRTVEIGGGVTVEVSRNALSIRRVDEDEFTRA